MKKFIQNDISKRFSNIYYILLAKKKIKNQKDLADRIGSYSYIIGDILKGKRNLTIEQARKLVEFTNLNSEWLLTGKGRVFANKKNNKLELDYIDELNIIRDEYKTRLEELEKELKAAKKEIEEKNNLISKIKK